MLALHEAADGWLARVRVPGGRLASSALLALAAIADELGNGLVDVTARANVQLRGLGDAAGAQLATRLQDAGLLPSLTHDRVRNVMASPLAGRAPGALDHVDAIVAQLDAGICASAALGELPGRFCFLVDDGSGAGRDVGPDVTVVARGDGRFGVALDAHTVEFEGDGPAAVDFALRAAEAFVAVRGDAWRLSETPGGARAVATALGLALVPYSPATRTRAFGPGATQQRDGRVALTALAPLGQLWPELLRALASLPSRRAPVDAPHGDDRRPRRERRRPDARRPRGGRARARRRLGLGRADRVRRDRGLPARAGRRARRRVTARARSQRTGPRRALGGLRATLRRDAGDAGRRRSARR